MKNIIALLLLLALSTSVFSQEIVNKDYQLYKRKVESYGRMKRTGSTLGIIGGAATIGGVLLIANADWETTTDTYGNTNKTTGDVSGVFGVLGVAVGVPLAITGIVLNSVGNRKVRQYAEKMKNVSVGVYQKGDIQGVALVVRF